MSYIVTVLEKFHIICLIAGELSSHKTNLYFFLDKIIIGSRPSEEATSSCYESQGREQLI